MRILSLRRAAALGALLSSMLAVPAGATIVALDIDITLDQLSPEETHFTIGQHHEARVFYDDTKIDPVSHRVAVLHEQHTPALIPKHLNPGQMPMSNAWLDLSGPVIRYHFAAAPTAAFPFLYFVLFDETTMRMTIRKQSGWLTAAGGTLQGRPQAHYRT